MRYLASIMQFVPTIGDIVTLTIPAFLEFHQSAGKPSYNRHIVILLDCSRSTNNSGGRRIMEQEEKKTPIIIEAECNATIDVLMKYIEHFDMTGCCIHFIVFSSTFETRSYQISKNEDVYQIVNDIGPMKYEQGNTILLAPLQHAFGLVPVENQLDVILITDGECQDKNEVLNFLTERQQTPNYIIIGTGSIGDSMGTRRIRSFGGRESSIQNVSANPNGVVLDVSELPRVNQRGGKQECDIEYLLKLATLKQAKSSRYVGAYGDNSEARNAMDQFCCEQKFAQFRIMLDNKKWWDYPADVNESLSVGNIVMVKLNGTHYLVSPNVQIAVEGNDLPDFLPSADEPLIALLKTHPEELKGKQIQFGQFWLLH